MKTGTIQPTASLTSVLCRNLKTERTYVVEKFQLKIPLVSNLFFKM